MDPAREDAKMANSPQASSLAGHAFDTADDAATAAIDEINPTSIKQNVEFAGRVFQNPKNRRFFFTHPNRGARDDSPPGPKIHGMINVGTYHTHAGNFSETDEIFSPTDMLKASMANEYSWIGTPHQRILRFTPQGLLDKGYDYDPQINGRVDVLRNIWVLPEITIVGDPNALDDGP
jgi:uncharacterized protein DUF4329